MENKLVEAFVKQVSELIPDDAEKDKLFEALRKYQGSSDVPFLVQDLKRVLNDPTKLEIYDYVRPLIRPAHQQQYDKLTPNAPGTKLRVIKLRRRNNESFGFAVRGGKEHGVGIFVSNVQRGSQADLRGLKLGDEIVRVNGFTIVEAIHEEVLNLIKGKDEIELKVTNLGMVPIKQKPTDPVSWQYVEKESLVKKNSVPSSGYEGPGEVVKIFINLRGASSLGCSIVSGPKQFPGIFIERVGPGSLGAEYGLEVGDQILEVNNRSFLNIRHNEAIVELKGSKELNIVLKKKAALPLLNAKNMVNPQDSPTAERNEDSVSRSTVDSEDTIGDEVAEELYATVNKTREEDQEKERKLQAEEQIRAKFREQERQRQIAEEERQAEEILQAEESAREEAEKARREVEQLRRAEEERRLREDEERAREQRERELAAEREAKEDRKKQEKQVKKQQSAVLAGRVGSASSMKPTLLGAATGSKSSFGKLTKKTIKEVEVIKEEDIPLDMELEGGIGSPLGGKIVVSEIYYNGAVDRNGGIGKGDTILKVNGVALDDMSLSQAQELLWKVEQECKPGGSIKFAIVESEIKHEDEITFF